ncbi:DUF445 domain-containing protein [Selenomonas ruminis]|uniref:DUF445 domain-containing protein n=1 Tax=Selenomonas ruminis TaxID=2593411 RepID=A0A5D6WCE3_9FIRM|nr:DUF445 domain-containing protein [Selenomonas sp. mPRGC5]TYZ24478.1 DUF445 domain-containing protein [Selenomonas sp. mPRGC5]
MRWADWNKADKTLLLALLIFFLALALHLTYPDKVLADAFLFCAEAALVGGIADWFAVTAIFRKPLGFPYHTAILPRRRQSFIEASVTMVQKEFFSRRKVFRHLERLHLLPMLLSWLAEPETENQLVLRLVHYARDFLLQQDAKAQAKVIAGRFRGTLDALEPEPFFAMWGGWLRQTGKDKEFLSRVAIYLRSRAAAEETRGALAAMFERYGEEKVQDNSLGAFLMGLAKAVDLVNYDEAAKLVQQQIVVMLDDLATKDSHLQQEMLALFYEKAAELNQEPSFHELVHELKDRLVNDLPLEEAVFRTLDHLHRHFAEDKARHVDPLTEHMPALRTRLEEILRGEYRRMLQLVKSDEVLRRSVGHFLYDLIARTALHAQTLVGVIVTNVLSRLTDEQLNHLVYDKVEPDLLWIRMNGSIVGAGIGLLLFILIRCAG